MADLARNWAFVIYPAECYGDWQERLKELHITACASPLHSPEGNEKKEHIHIVVCGEKKSKEQIFENVCQCLGETVTDGDKMQIKGVTRPEKVQNIGAYVRYLVHYDDKDKQQFAGGKDEIVLFSGMEIDSYFEKGGKSKYILSQEILEACNENEIKSFYALVCFCAKENKQEWYACVMDNSYFFSCLLKSKNQQKGVDKLSAQALE